MNRGVIEFQKQKYQKLAVCFHKVINRMLTEVGLRIVDVGFDILSQN